MSAKEAMDLSGSRRRGGSAPKAGSVWESRMKVDQFKGGIKVFKGTHDDHSNNNDTQNTTTIATNGSTTTTSPSSPNNSEIQMDKKAVAKQSPIGKRKTWKSDSIEGSPLQIARQRSESSGNSDELSVSGDGVRKNPVSQIRKTRNPLRKVKSDSVTEAINGSGNGDAANSELKKVKSGNIENFGDDEPNRALNPVGSDAEDCKEFGVCEDKAITTTSNVGKFENKGMADPSDAEEIKNEGPADPSDAEEIKNEGPAAPSDDDDDFADVEGGDDKESEAEKKSVDVKEISVKKKIVIQNNKRTVPISPVVKKLQPPPSLNHAKIHPIPSKTKPSSDNYHPRTNSRLQSFVDLVMWRDVSKSAFIFGIGTFAIISSSYTKDLNISFISVASYLGLVYLAANFLFRSLISRRSMANNEEYVVGEEEAIWVIKLILPYINEFLLKLRALFSGDPSTTMKLAVLLFILARGGSSITVWKMAKLGFIGVFTVPKICSTYSSQLTAFGTFWIRRFRDAWESCTHKKAVGFAIFTLVWNLSSVVARIWAVFVLFVAFKYYNQKSLMQEGWVQEEEEAATGSVAKNNTSSSPSRWQGQDRLGQRRSTQTQMSKQKKVF